MNHIRAMKVFTEVVKQGGFRKAGDELNIATSVVSRLVSELEDWLEVKLLNRTTRQISLSGEGEVYLPQFTQVLADIEAMKKSAHDQQTTPRGTLKITASVYVGKYFLEPILPSFLKAYPGIKVSLLLVDRIVNLIEEGIDIGIRIAHLPDSNLVARQLGEMSLKVTASPEYIAEHGAPKDIHSLQAHNCLVDTITGQGDRWRLKDGNKSKTIKVQGNMAVNSGEMVKLLTLDGVGISRLPEFFVNQEISQGKLLHLLPDSIDFKVPISSVYPHNKYLTRTVRVFIDHLIEHFPEIITRGGTT